MRDRRDAGGELAARRGREAAAGLWPIRRALTVAGVGAVVGLAAVTVVALALLPHLAASKGLPVTDLLEVLKLVLGTVAGVGALAALVMNYRKQRLAEAAETREHQRAADDRVRVFNERFATAAGQLGHDEPAVRLAGVYAMAGLADDWEDGRQTCVDVLCAYLRMPYEHDPGEDAPAAERLAFGRNQEVRHAIIKLITAHLRDGARVSWQGHDFDFTGTRFDGGDFSDAIFSGGTIRFIGAKFSGGTVDFRDATFSGGRVDFSDAAFSGGTIHFIGAIFSGGTIDFSDAIFSGAMVHLRQAIFSGGTIHFSQAIFSGGRVDFIGAKFSGATVDLSDPFAWAAPPAFSSNVAQTAAPAGLLLPPAAPAPITGPPQAGPRPDQGI